MSRRQTQYSGAESGSAPGDAMRPGRRMIAMAVAAGALIMTAAAGMSGDGGTKRGGPSGPPGDFGDALVGDVADGIEAYPGVLARWTSWYFHRNTVTAPVQHLHGTWLKTGATFQLGTIGPTSTPDTTQTPNSPENDGTPIIVLEALGPNPLAQLHVTVSTTPAHDPTQPFFLNVFVDQNRTGEWKDGFHLGTQVFAWDLEWVVQDMPIMMPPGEVRELTMGHIRLANPTHSVWLRCIVSDWPIGTALKSGQRFWDGTMTAVHGWKGEVEDHFLEYHTTYQPGKGIFPWWVFGRGNPPSGGGNPKPACDAFYQAPRTVLTPWCADGFVFFNTIYRVTERDDGCDPGLLFGMYGLKHLTGVVDPPNVFLNNPAFFVPGTLGTDDLTCPDGTVLTLPPNVEGFGPMFQGHVTKDTLRNGPLGGAAWRACYPTPRRFRAYRAFLEVMSCGSVHQSTAVRTGPPYSHTPSAIAAVGQRVDHVDFMAGDLVESFIDLEDGGRPFPDPNFRDAEVIPTAPGGEGFLSEEMFTSPPASMQLSDAMFSIRPWMPNCVDPEVLDPGRGETGDDESGRCPVRAVSVSFNYFAVPGSDLRGANTVTLISTLGNALSDVLPDSGTWATHVITLPEDFELDTVQIALGDGWIDDLVVELDDIVDCNGNNVHDAYDIARGTSFDLDGNGIPDECEMLSPCDGYCGALSPAGCWCDEDCVLLGDCCVDYDLFCLAPEPCPGDANGDGVVNVLDLLLVISNWGSVGPDGDVNGDGIVNVLDLLLVISNWGSTCP